MLWHAVACCGMLWHDAVCCGRLRRVVACCGMLWRDAVCYSVLWHAVACCGMLWHVGHVVCCGILWHAVACYGPYASLVDSVLINSLTPKIHYSGRTAPVASKRYILYIYSTNIGIEYFKHGIHCPCFSLQNAVCFVILIYLFPVLFTFYIQGVLKLKKIIGAPKG